MSTTSPAEMDPDAVYVRISAWRSRAVCAFQGVPSSEGLSAMLMMPVMLWLPVWKFTRPAAPRPGTRFFTSIIAVLHS